MKVICNRHFRWSVSETVMTFDKGDVISAKNGVKESDIEEMVAHGYAEYQDEQKSFNKKLDNKMLKSTDIDNK